MSGKLNENVKISLIYHEAVACIQQFYRSKGMLKFEALEKAGRMFERARRHHLRTGNARTLQNDLTKYFEVPDPLIKALKKWNISE